MAYQELQFPHGTPDVVRRILDATVQPVFRDVHAMLRLPLPDAGIEAGCNFSILQVLLSTVAGVSAVVYSPNGFSGTVFREFLTKFYPWDAERQRPGLSIGHDASKVIYEEYRNPFAHALGTSVQTTNPKARVLRNRPYTVKVKRLTDRTGHFPTGLLEVAIEELERATERPSWLSTTLVVQDHKRVISVEALYWGLRQAILRLCADESRMEAATEFLKDARMRPRKTG